MCGILGIIGPESEGKDLSASLAALALRGPDRQAQIRVGNALLGHTRLSIIDISHLADQPMQDPSGRYTLVFNGEIYNYRTIADSLRKEGLEFKSDSDTEVLLHLLIQKGIEALKEINGFFAFAFHDAKEDWTLIARDRIGIKPLYFSVNDKSIFFSSEMKGLSSLTHDLRIDHTALHLFFRFNYIPQGCSIFEGIQQLDPGQYVERKGNKIILDRYYSLDKKVLDESLYDLLEDAVKIRLVSDVPLGSFLSGGVDSSIIAALATELRPGLRTFSIGFKDNASFDESAFAEMVAKHIGSEHRTIHLYEEEMLQHVDLLLDYLDEPFADSSAIAMHALSQHTRRDVTVALSGDGADELFGGYNKHQAHMAALAPTPKDRFASLAGSMSKWIRVGHGSKLGNLIRQSQRFNAGIGLKAFERYWAWASWTSREEVEALLAGSPDDRYSAILNVLGPKNESLEEVLLSDTRCVLPCDMLTKVDRMSMANSLEVRVPFLDHRIVEYAHSLEAAGRFRRNHGKYILREQFGHLLPQEIFERKKKGFEVPLEAWFLGPLNAKLKSVLTDGLLLSSGLFSIVPLRNLEQKLNRGRISADVHLLWALMVFHRFYSRFGHSAQ